jgi:hypothetical protein
MKRDENANPTRGSLKQVVMVSESERAVELSLLPTSQRGLVRGLVQKDKDRDRRLVFRPIFTPTKPGRKRGPNTT